MLPEFPAARRKMLELWNRAFFMGVHGSDPFVSSIPVRVQKEGDRACLRGTEMDYKTVSVSRTVPARDAEGLPFVDFVKSAQEFGIQMAQENAKIFFTELKPGPHAAPLSIEGELSFDHLLSLWSKMEIDFNDEGHPEMPAIVGGTVLREEIKAKLPGWLQDPVQHRKMTELLAIKRKEFDERETRRRLVD